MSKKKDNEGVLFLNGGVVDVSYTTGAQSLRAGLPPFDLATTKDFSRHYALSSDGTLNPRLTTESLNSQYLRARAADDDIRAHRRHERYYQARAKATLYATKLRRERLQQVQAGDDAEAPKQNLLARLTCSMALEIPQHLRQKTQYRYP